MTRIAIIFSLVIMCQHVYQAALATLEWADKPASIEIDNETLHSALERLGKTGGVTIVYDETLAKDIVSGIFTEKPIVDIVARLFKNQNKIIQVYDREEKIILVKTFGTNNYILAGAWEHPGAPGPITLAELRRMHDEQYRAYKDRLADDNEMLEGGMTRAELRNMIEDQYERYQARIADDQLIDGGEMTFGQLHAMHEVQHQVMRDEFSQAYVEEKNMHREQYEKYSQRVRDGTLVFEDGESLSELRKRHQEQYSQYRKRLTQ
jgi:hypothetical protein